MEGREEVRVSGSTPDFQFGTTYPPLSCFLPTLICTLSKAYLHLW